MKIQKRPGSNDKLIESYDGLEGEEYCGDDYSGEGRTGGSRHDGDKRR